VETIGEFNRTHTSYPLQPKQYRPKRQQAVINQSALRINNDYVDTIIIQMTNSLTTMPTIPARKAIYKAIIQADKLTPGETAKLNTDVEWIRNRYVTLKNNKNNKEGSQTPTTPTNSLNYFKDFCKSIDPLTTL
jgi:hypothetical protein